MENSEEVLQWLEEVSRRRPAGPAVIPRALDEYLAWVARTGEPLFRWPLVRALLKEKLAAVVADYRAQPPGLDIPPCPNVPPFDCDAMRACFLAKLDAFRAAPFTVQRICELLAHPRKHYNRIDKFMRAFEKNILVVSIKRQEPFRHTDTESHLDGSDANDVNSEPSDANDPDENEWKERTHRTSVNGPLEPPAGSSEQDPPSVEMQQDLPKPQTETEQTPPAEPQPSNPPEETPAKEETEQPKEEPIEAPKQIEMIEDKPPQIPEVTNVEKDSIEPLEEPKSTTEPIEEKIPEQPIPDINTETALIADPAPTIEPEPASIQESVPISSPPVEQEPIVAIAEPIPMDCGTEPEEPKVEITPVETPLEKTTEPEAMDCTETPIIETKTIDDIADTPEETLPITTAVTEHNSP